MSYTSLLYHVVFSTKNRVPFLEPDSLPRVQQYIGGTLRSLKSKLLAAGDAADHVHLAASLHPTHAVADAVRIIKCNSTNWIHDTFPRWRNFEWQEGYAAFTVSQSVLSRLERYIANQAAHHAKHSFVDELRALLTKHRIEFDEAHLL